MGGGGGEGEGGVGDSRPPPPSTEHQRCTSAVRVGHPSHATDFNRTKRLPTQLRLTLDELVPLKGRISAVIAIQIRDAPLLPGCIAGPLTYASAEWSHGGAWKCLEEERSRHRRRVAHPCSTYTHKVLNAKNVKYNKVGSEVI